MKLTDYLNSINYEKNDVFVVDPEVAEKNYIPYIINRCLSYFTDTILHANQMICTLTLVVKCSMITTWKPLGNAKDSVNGSNMK
jgi:hypothetical protein